MQKQVHKRWRVQEVDAELNYFKLADDLYKLGKYNVYKLILNKRIMD